MMDKNGRILNNAVRDTLNAERARNEEAHHHQTVLGNLANLLGVPVHVGPPPYFVELNGKRYVYETLYTRIDPSTGVHPFTQAGEALKEYVAGRALVTPEGGRYFGDGVPQRVRAPEDTVLYIRVLPTFIAIMDGDIAVCYTRLCFAPEPPVIIAPSEKKVEVVRTIIPPPSKLHNG